MQIPRVSVAYSVWLYPMYPIPRIYPLGARRAIQPINLNRASRVSHNNPGSFTVMSRSSAITPPNGQRRVPLNLPVELLEHILGREELGFRDVLRCKTVRF